MRRTADDGGYQHAVDIQNDEGFQIELFEHVEDILFDTLLQVEKHGNDVSNPNKQKLFFNLPLLISESDETESMMVGAALALSHADLVRAMVLRCPDAKLGFGLTKLSSKSLLEIMKIFQECTTDSTSFLSFEEVYQFVYFGIFSEKFRTGKPVIAPLRSQYSKEEALALRDLTENLGFYLIPVTAYSEMNQLQKRQPYAKFRLRPFSDRDMMGRLYLSNFRGKFTMPRKGNWQSAR